MGMIKCKECGAEISTKADACPKCGAKQVRTSGCAKIVLVAIGLFVFLVVVGQLGRNGSPSATQKEPIGSALAAQEIVPSFTAADIARAYEANTVAADQQFKGKKFQVTGTVVDISTDFLDNPYVTLSGGVNQFMEPHFGFDKAQAADLAQLRKGQEITMVCTGHGDVAKTPMSEDCVLR
jgi:hypothetical protein